MDARYMSDSALRMFTCIGLRPARENPFPEALPVKPAKIAAVIAFEAFPACLQLHPCSRQAPALPCAAGVQGLSPLTLLTLDLQWIPALSRSAMRR